MSRRRHSLTALFDTRRRVSDLLGGALLYLLDYHQVRHWVYLYTFGPAKANCRANCCQHGRHGARGYSCSDLRFCKLQAVCSNMESSTVSPPPHFI